jgi:hypothetical protein
MQGLSRSMRRQRTTPLPRVNADFHFAPHASRAAFLAATAIVGCLDER